MRKLLSNIFILAGACTVTMGLTLWITTSRLITLQESVADKYLLTIRDPEMQNGLKFVPTLLKRIYLAGGIYQQYDTMIVVCSLGLIGIFVGLYLGEFRTHSYTKVDK